MSTLKRTYKDVDPDYTDVCEQQTKRQKEMEQDAKHNVSRRIQAIVRNEFRKEINNKDLELHQVDRKLSEARLMMDRLRAFNVFTYYGQIDQSGTSEVSRMSGPPSSIHPSVKKHLGKRPSNHELSSDLTMCHIQPLSRPELSFIDVSDCTESAHQRSDSRLEQQNKSPVRSRAYQSLASTTACSTSPYEAHGASSAEASYDDRRAIFKIKKKIIIGNVSKYIPVDHREANDKSSHKWMVYVRGPKLEPNISGFVKKVLFFLHHSYKPNDLVEISCPPFHLTRRGWGEFPVRVQLHFVDSRNKKVDIIHQLKLDKTFSGLQTLGAETTVELDLEKDFFEQDTSLCSINMRPTSGGSSIDNLAQLSSSSGLKSAKMALGYRLACSQIEEITSPEQSQMNLSNEIEAGNTDTDSVTEVLDASSGVQTAGNKYDSCLIEVGDVCQPAYEVEIEAISSGENVQSLEEYNVTIVHDTEECTDNRHKEKSMAVVISDRLKVEQENIMNPSVIPEMNTCVSVSHVRGQPTLSLTTTNTQAALTVINKPQWIYPGNSYTSDRNDHCTSTPQISKPAKNVLSSSVVLMTANELCVKQSSSLTSVKQLCLSAPSSILPLSLSTLPISSMAPVVRASTSCSGQSSAHMSLPLMQNEDMNACSVSGNTHSVIDSCVLPLSHQVNENRSPYSSDVQKLIIVTSNTPCTVPELASINAAGFEKRLQQPKASGPRQVSLLTGKVFSPQAQCSSTTKISSATYGSNESLLTSNHAVIKQASHQTADQVSSANQTAKCVSKGEGQIHLLKTVNHPSLSTAQSASHLGRHLLTLTNQITDVNGVVMPELTTQPDNLPIVNVTVSTENQPLPISLLSNTGAQGSSNIQASHNGQMEIRRTNVVLVVPGQDKSHLINDQYCNVYPKMSAIGMTKLRKNSATVLTRNINSRSTTDEERKKNQYEVLMAWKRNRLLQEKAKQLVKIPNDTIEGEADIIPELNLDDYTSMRALVRAAVKLHPLVESGINKLTHPYCAESVEEWVTWTLGKQLASEWHRACFVLKYLKSLLGKSVSFIGEQLMTTRQLVRWCRLHAFSPLTAVVKAKLVDAHEDRDSQPFQNRGHNPSFTRADTLKIDITAEAALYGPEASNGSDDNLLDILATDADRTRESSNIILELGNDNTIQEWLPPSNGTLFVLDELRKRGVRFQPNKLQPGVMSYTAADMLYRAMQEFLADVLRETVAVSAWQISQSPAAEITTRDVHQALTQLPEAAFSCNRFLGKDADATDDSGR